MCGEYLNRVLSSIINQTYENIEILLIDDGSSDNSPKICDEYSKKDSRIRVFHKENEGVSIARNLGIDNAKGKYITFVDADDYVEKNYVEVLYNLCKENDCEVSICGTVNEIKGKKKTYETDEMKACITGKEAIKLMLTKTYFGWTCWTKMYKLDKIKNIKFLPKIRIAEDVDFLYNVLKSVEKVNVDTFEKPYHYIKRENSATRVNIFNEDRKREVEIYKFIKEDMEKIIPEASKEIQSWYFKRVLFGIRMILKTSKDDEYLEYLRLEIKSMNKTWIMNKYISLKNKILYVGTKINGG